MVYYPVHVCTAGLCVWLCRLCLVPKDNVECVLLLAHGIYTPPNGVQCPVSYTDEAILLKWALECCIIYNS